MTSPDQYTTGGAQRTRVLSYVRTHPFTPVADIARDLDIEPRSLSKTIQRLRASGHIHLSDLVWLKDYDAEPHAEHHRQIVTLLRATELTVAQLAKKTKKPLNITTIAVSELRRCGIVHRPGPVAVDLLDLT